MLEFVLLMIALGMAVLGMLLILSAYILCVRQRFTEFHFFGYHRLTAFGQRLWLIGFTLIGCGFLGIALVTNL